MFQWRLLLSGEQLIYHHLVEGNVYLFSSHGQPVKCNIMLAAAIAGQGYF